MLFKIVDKFLVSNETVMLWWGKSETWKLKFGFIKELIKIELPLWKIWKADVLSLSICSDVEGQQL